MTLQNRVTPRAEIVVHPGRGLFLGNRGCLCDEAGRLAARRWRLKAWITCALDYKGWWRPVMQPGVWTELFFLDEATALAAGHRPCALCRREAYDRFVRSWQAGNGWQRRPKAVEIDAVMHRDRVRRDRSQVTFEAPPRDLPDGAMVWHRHDPWLIAGRRLHRWTPAGYDGTTALPLTDVTVLTPRCTVATLRAGFVPVLHPSSVMSPATAGGGDPGPSGRAVITAVSRGVPSRHGGSGRTP